MEEEMNSFLIIFEVMGLQYFSLKSLNFDKLKKRPSARRTLLMLTLLIFMTFVTFFFIKVDQDKSENHHRLEAKTFITFTIHHSMNIGLVVVILSSIVQSFMSNWKVEKIYQNAKEIAKVSFEEFNVVIDFKKIKKASQKRLAALLTLFLSVHFTTRFLHTNTFEDIVVMFFAVLPVLYLVMTVFKFVFYVGMVNCQLGFTAKLIENIFKKPQTLALETVNLQKIFVKPSKKFEDPLRKLIAARKILNLTCENGALVNDSNGFTLLLVLTDLVIALTVSGYEIFVIVIGGMPTKQVPRKLITFVKHISETPIPLSSHHLLIIKLS